MRGLTKAQRVGLLERLKRNHKYGVVVSFAATFPEKQALEFSSVFQEAGWGVTGPFVSEKCSGRGLQICVPDLHCPCASGHLLIDVFVSVGLDATLVQDPEVAHPTQSADCRLLLNSLETNQAYKGPSDSSKTPWMYDI